MKQEKSYLIRPLSPLVFRSAKPFGSLSDASDIIFPLPSSGAGLIRTQTLLQNHYELVPNSGDSLTVTEEDQKKLLEIGHKGPFLVVLGEDSNYTIYVHKPANALYLKNKESGKIELIRLTPQSAVNEEMTGSDLPADLLPVMMERNIKGKPQPGPMLWPLQQLIEWQNGKNVTFEALSEQGIQSLPVDVRTHVAIDNSTHAGIEGQLFQSASYDFGAMRKDIKEGGWHDRSYGFLLLSDADLHNNHVRFGGESRLSEMQTVAMSQDLIMPQSLALEVEQAKGLQLTLLTPAIFSNGYLPAWLEEKTLTGVLPHTSIQVRLKACAMDRWLPVSGWDLHQKKPKAMRKAVASGAVYWFEVLEGDISSITNLYFSSVSDQIQDQKDGFGIVAVAPWSIQ